MRNYDLAAAILLYDRDGRLTQLQRQIKSVYTNEHWSKVRATSVWESLKPLEAFLGRLRNEQNLARIGDLLGLWLTSLCQVLVCLRNRSMSLRALLPRVDSSLCELGMPDLYTEILKDYGFSDAYPGQVGAWLQTAESLYDRAISSPNIDWLKSDLRPEKRAYWVQGTEFLIKEGRYREAVLPISVVLFQLRPVLSQMGEEPFGQYRRTWDQFKNWVGLDDEAVLYRYQVVQSIAERVNMLL